MSRKNRNQSAPAAGDPSLTGGAGPGADEDLDDTIEGTEGDGGDDGAPLDVDERAELEALRAENAALKKKRKGPPAAAPAAAPAPAEAVRLPKWVGTIQHGVAIVVEAKDEVHAEQEYKRAAGIIRTEYPITIGSAPDDAELGPVNK